MPFHEKNGHTIRGGANFKTHYNYYYYELHDGHLFWLTQIGVSPLIQYGFQWDNRRINAALQNSLFGFTYFRHRQGYDPYVWMFDWKDWVFTANKNLKFGSFNRYNHTTLSLEFVPNIAKRHSIGYEFDYLGFYEGYHFHQINHNLIWRVSLCGRKKQKH